MKGSDAVLRRLFLLLAIAGLALAPAAAGAAPVTLRAEVANPPVNVGDTFQLLISLVGRDSLEPPNISVLSRDFDILDRGKGGSTAMVEGREVPVSVWFLTLAPKRAGRLVIPAITVGSETTAPVQLVVAPGVVTGPPDDAPVSIQVDVAGNPPFFALGDIPVRVRIFDRAETPLSEPTLPTADGMPLVADGAWRMFPRTFGNQRYRVIERRFVLRPQREGVITIPPVTVMAAQPGTAPDAARRVEVRSAPISVTVQPRPAGAQGWFLPARAVMLTRTWSTPLAEAKVGVALTSKIHLAALGASANQLPTLAVPAPDSVRQYVEETRRAPAIIEGEPGALMEMEVSVVPTETGSVTLPAIPVPWWNTATGRAELAILPEQTFTVAPAPAGTAPASGGLAARPALPSPAPPAIGAAPLRSGGEGGKASGAAPGAGTPLGGEATRLLRWLLDIGWEWLAGGVGIAALAVFGMALVRRGGEADAAPAMPEGRAVPMAVVRRAARPVRSLPAAGAEAAARALEAACRSRDAAAAHRAGLDWRRAQGGAFLTPGMADVMEVAGRHLYGGAAGWEAAAFRKAFKAERRAARRGATPAARPRLAPLYPGAR